MTETGLGGIAIRGTGCLALARTDFMGFEGSVYEFNTWLQH